MNRTLAIYSSYEIPQNVLTTLNEKYSTIFLCGSKQTIKYNTNMAYIHISNIRYNSNIDILFTNVGDIDKIDTYHNRYYLFDTTKIDHNIHYTEVSQNIIRFNKIIVIGNINQELIQQVYGYTGEIEYV